MSYHWNREEDIIPYFERFATMEFLIDTRSFSSLGGVPSFSWIPCIITVIRPLWPSNEKERLRFTLRCIDAFPDGTPPILRQLLLENEYTISGLDQLCNRSRPKDRDEA